jgi:hypothetical protein
MSQRLEALGGVARRCLPMAASIGFRSNSHVLLGCRGRLEAMIPHEQPEARVRSAVPITGLWSGMTVINERRAHQASHTAVVSGRDVSESATISLPARVVGEGEVPWPGLCGFRNLLGSSSEWRYCFDHEVDSGGERVVHVVGQAEAVPNSRWTKSVRPIAGLERTLAPRLLGLRTSANTGGHIHRLRCTTGVWGRRQW